MSNSINFEKEILTRGALKIGEFTTRAGLSANCKLELGNDFLKADPELTDQIVENLAEQLGVYDPRLIVPVPSGANFLGELISKRLQVSYLALDKDKKSGYRFRPISDRSYAEGSESIALVDDVFTTGSSLRDLNSMPEFNGSVVVAGVIWDRSKPQLPKNLDFDVVSVVRKYVPLISEAAP